MGVKGLREFLESRAEGDLLPWEAQSQAVQRFHQSLAQIEEAILEGNLLPTRYRRNRQTLSIQDQLKLFRSRVAIIGCGGLGGYLIEELARVGVGTLVLVDPDVFEEHNLNRQLLASFSQLGRQKVEVGRERVSEINPAVTVVTHAVAFSGDNGRQLLNGCSAVIDGLDSIAARRELASLCCVLALPLIHGAIAGWYGQVTTQMPGGDLSPLLRSLSTSGKGVETTLGNPSFTPAVIASLQVAEVVKILTGQGKPLSGKVLYVNLLDLEFDGFDYS